MEWKYGDPTGAKSIMEGPVQKAAVESGDMNYQNEHVPPSVQKQLDQQNINEGNAKIILGSAKATKFIIHTSFDVISTVAPVGEGISVLLKGPKLFITVSRLNAY